MKGIKVFCKDEGKIGEILKFLFKNNISFDIMGRQALVLSSEKGYKKLASDKWFEVERVDKFPPECWRDMKRIYDMFLKNVPDRFVPVDIPPQKTRPHKHVFKGKVGEIRSDGIHIDAFDRNTTEFSFVLEHRFEKWLEQFDGKEVKVIVVVKNKK